MILFEKVGDFFSAQCFGTSETKEVFLFKPKPATLVKFDENIIVVVFTAKCL
ncbi:MAG: hypothetical protein OXU45_02780 [Candidatus Melainabacteria bacterium]|nr:hypothetical protein [Candidatus Melainabacteria bacterium]